MLFGKRIKKKLFMAFFTVVLVMTFSTQAFAARDHERDTTREPRITAINLNQTKATMSLNQTLQLSVASYAPASLAQPAVTWTTSNSKVARVDSNGLVTCVGPGNAKITATTKGESRKSAVCSITGPKAVAGVRITGSKNVGYRESVTLSADVRPAGAVNGNVKWTRIDGRAIIKDLGDNKCEVTCTGEGNIIIQASTKNGKTATYIIKGPQEAKGIKITGTKNVEYLKEVTLNATVSPANSVDKRVIWRKVSGNGTITDNKDGTCTVKCTGEGNIKVSATTVTGKEATFTVKGPKAASSVKITGPRSVEYQDSVTLSATVKPDNTPNKNVTWKKVAGNGRINVNEDGTCTVTCTGSGDIKVSATTANRKKTTYVVKGPKAASSVRIEGPKNVEYQKSVTLTATVKPDNAPDKTVTWSRVSGNGEVKDNQDGTCTVTCKGAGDIKIQAKTVTGKKSTFVVKGPKAASSVSVTASSNKLEIGQTAQATATVKPDNAIDLTVTWSSDNNDVATVSSDGTITAIAKGKVKIIARAHNGKTGKCTITVV